VSECVYITRRVVFAASHRLYSPQLSEEDNWTVFDKCSREKGHGHNFELFVTLKGVPDPITGLVMNLSHLKTILEDHILDPMDHRFLNDDIPEFKTLLPSIENLVIVVWNRLVPHIGDLLHEVKIIETENNFAFYRG
jgi:6-pyruvoyltetrahydropterin/6-carboxytetrahydropterin synthase